MCTHIVKILYNRILDKVFKTLILKDVKILHIYKSINLKGLQI